MSSPLRSEDRSAERASEGGPATDDGGVARLAEPGRTRHVTGAFLGLGRPDPFGDGVLEMEPADLKDADRRLPSPAATVGRV